MKSDLRVMDAIIDSLTYELTEVLDKLNWMQSEMRSLRNYYERLKKEHKELQKGEEE